MRQIITVPDEEFDRLVAMTHNPGEPSEGLRQSQADHALLLFGQHLERTCSECGFMKPTPNGVCPNQFNHPWPHGTGE